MRNYALAALLAGTAIATPFPQDFDWAAIDSLDPVPSASIPIVNAAAAATTVSFNPVEAATSVSAAVIANPTDVTPKEKRDTDSTCCATPASDDTAYNFINDPDFSSAAINAQTPSGYEEIYSNQPGSSEGIYGYMGYSTLDTYDVETCSSRCDAVIGCQSFNICKYRCIPLAAS